MWFDPGQLMKATKSLPAILATHATLFTQQRRAVVEVAKIAEVATGEVSRGWLIYFADRDLLDVYCSPDLAHARILERYPDALAAEPIPARPRRMATEDEEAELRVLVQAIGRREGWNVAEVEQASALALADPDGALICYRDLANELDFIITLDDDRHTCKQCANLEGRRCLAAWRGEIVANRDYEPVRDIPRRCEGYAPGEDDPDTRPGLERWPELSQKGNG